MSTSRNINKYGLVVCGLLVLMSGYYLLSKNDQKTAPESKVDSLQTVNKTEKSTKHDYLDIDFAKKMILVEQQAMQIANMGSQKTADNKTRDLASNIYASSESESQAYIKLLKDWNETYFNLSDFPEMEGHDMYPTFSGMMELSKIQQLSSLSGNDFDKSFLALMISHHEGAIELQTVKLNEDSTVKYEGILKFREKNVQKQREQIVEMEQLLKQITGI